MIKTSTPVIHGTHSPQHVSITVIVPVSKLQAPRRPTLPKPKNHAILTKESIN
jgi:hypothetical protein